MYIQLLPKHHRRHLKRVSFKTHNIELCTCIKEALVIVNVKWNLKTAVVPVKLFEFSFQIGNTAVMWGFR